MATTRDNGGPKKPVYKAECIHAVLVAQRLLAHEINSPAELWGYLTEGDFFTLGRINLTPTRKYATMVHLKVQVSKPADFLYPSRAEAIYCQLKRGGDARPGAPDALHAWARALCFACQHGVSPYAFKIGAGLAVSFQAEKPSRRPGEQACPAPVENRLRGGGDDPPALNDPDWPMAKQGSGDQRAEILWDYCFANDCAMDQKVERAWVACRHLYGLERPSADEIANARPVVEKEFWLR